MNNRPSPGYLLRSRLRIALYAGHLAVLLLALVAGIPAPYWAAALWFMSVAALIVSGQADWRYELRRQREQERQHQWD